jgi:hypothetical protein
MPLRPCLLLVIAIAAAGCGGAGSPAASPAPPVPPRVEPVEAIAQQVERMKTWYREIGPAPAGASPICTPAPPAGACTERCELTDHMCEGASNVCARATELDGHGWADSKCTDARSMCREARQACCACGQPPGSRPLVL